MILNTDGIFYNCPSPISRDQFENVISDRFEHFELHPVSEAITFINFQWLDNLKVNEKIIANKQASISFLVNHTENLLIIFSDSESHIAHFISRINHYFKAGLERVYVYNKIFESIFSSNHFELSSIDIDYINSTKTLDFVNFNKREIESFLKRNKEKITSIKVKLNDAHYEIDRNSVVSFPLSNDTDKILQFLEGVRTLS